MASSSDADIILKLYQLRTEAGMRAARKFMLHYEPSSFDEIAALMRDFGSEQRGYWRQVITYWEMAASFVLHDALDPELFAATSTENFYLYAKFTPYFEQWSKTFGEPFMEHTAKLIEDYSSMAQRYTIALARRQAQQKQKTE